VVDAARPVAVRARQAALDERAVEETARARAEGRPGLAHERVVDVEQVVQDGRELGDGSGGGCDDTRLEVTGRGAAQHLDDRGEVGCRGLDDGRAARAAADHRAPPWRLMTSQTNSS